MPACHDNCEQSLTALDSPSTPPFIHDINLTSIVLIAVSARSQLTASEISCTVGRDVIVGVHNAAWVITFEDGVQWVFRTPLLDYSPILEKRLQSDIYGVQLIQAKTKIPIPRIMDFCTSADNYFGRPYLIVEKPRGVPLSDLWSDPKWLSDEKRQIVFKSLASAMSQLRAIEFNEIGSLYIDPMSSMVVVGPTIPSYQEISDGHDTVGGTYQTTHRYLLGEIRRQLSLNTEESRKPFLALMRVFAGFIPDPTFDERPFVLSAPRIDLRSVFVDEGGDVTAITEWDSLFVGPREGGYAKYPSWITLDWDPITDRFPSEKDTLLCDEEYPTLDDDTVHLTSDSPANILGNDLRSNDQANLRDIELQTPGGNKNINLTPNLATNTAADKPLGTEAVSTSNTEALHPNLGFPKKNIPAMLEAFRSEYLEAFTEVDSSSARYTRFSHIFNALERTILSSESKAHILDKFKQFCFGPRTLSDDGDLLEVSVLLGRLSMGKWIHDI